MKKGTLIKVINHQDETATIVYRDENLEKKKIVKTNMVVDYYMLKKDKPVDLFVKIEDTIRVESQYNKIIESIVENIDDPLTKQKAEMYVKYIDLNFRGSGNDRLKSNLLRLPGVYGADEPLENRAIEWFYNNYEEDLKYNPSEYTAFFDIETDLMPDGKTKRDGPIDLVNTPDPVNIISLYYQDIMYIFAYNYGTKNKSFTEFITKFPDIKQKLQDKIYERNNSTYVRGGKTLKGKDIPLKDIKLLLFNSENELIRAFFDKVHQLDPDFMFAWNMSFDVRTLFGRLEQTQKEILRLSGEEHRRDIVRSYVESFLRDPKYSQDEDGNDIFPRYFYYITDEHTYTDASNRRDYAEISDGINWLDQLIMRSILNNSESNDSDALEDVAQEMFDIGKVDFGVGQTIFNIAWLDYEKFFEYSIQDTMLLKKIESELYNATEVFELSALYKCLPKDVFSQTKSTKSFMAYEAKKEGYVLRNNVNAMYSNWQDPHNMARKEFDRIFGMDIRTELISEIASHDNTLFNLLMDKDNHGGYVADSALNTNKNGISLYPGIRSNSIFGSSIDKDFSSLYPSTKHALSIDDDGAIARYAIYDNDIIEKHREKDYDKAYIWKSAPKKSDIQDHWLLTDEGDIEDQNLMIRLYDYMCSKTYSKIGEDFLGLPNTTELITELIKGGR